MKKVLCFIFVMCMAVSLSGVCFATDPMVDASAKFAALSQEEKDKLYELSDKTIENVAELLNEYAACGIIDAKTCEMVVSSLEAHLADAKENGELPGFLPPPPSFQPKDKSHRKSVAFASKS